MLRYRTRASCETSIPSYLISFKWMHFRQLGTFWTFFEELHNLQFSIQELLTLSETSFSFLFDAILVVRKKFPILCWSRECKESSWLQLLQFQVTPKIAKLQIADCELKPITSVCNLSVAQTQQSCKKVNYWVWDSAKDLQKSFRNVRKRICHEATNC